MHADPAAQAARADLCRYLAACYYEPGPEFAEEKMFESMLAAATRVDPQLAAGAGALGRDFDETGHRKLLLDYARLFLGPGNALANPYESVWVDDVTGKAASSVVDLYREGGFDLADSFRDLPDHVACELEFLYVLLFREGQARATDDGAAAAAACALRVRLLEEHLGAWIGPFTAAVADGAQSVFYRELARLTERFVGLEAARLR